VSNNYGNRVEIIVELIEQEAGAENSMQITTNRMTLGNMRYGIAKFAFVFISVSVAFTILASLVPNGRERLEYPLIATMILAEAWAFAPSTRSQFSLRSLFLAMTLIALILGVFSAVRG
jgi:hypothetical protein